MDGVSVVVVVVGRRAARRDFNSNDNKVGAHGRPWPGGGGSSRWNVMLTT